MTRIHAHSCNRNEAGRTPERDATGSCLAAEMLSNGRGLRGLQGHLRPRWKRRIDLGAERHDRSRGCAERATDHDLLEIAAADQAADRRADRAADDDLLR